ncbi:hypothetical protein ACFQLX_13580 [Streptomyces polyrhachis]|uniref:Uncharacterized protein n=1 Tax=Streptomyces polyrhachis TaxID=1282885 RepID=A0ABW2GEI9_9ACTN
MGDDMTAREEQRLRHALTLINDVVGDEEARMEAQPHARARRRGALTAGALACIAALAVGIGVALNAGDSSAPSSNAPEGREEADNGQSLEEWIACAPVIVEGDVLTVRQAAQGRVVVTLEVKDWIKPAQGKKRIELDVLDPTPTGVGEPWQEGSHVLAGVPERRDQPADTFHGAEIATTRARIEGALARAADTVCPPPWRKD